MSNSRVEPTAGHHYLCAAGARFEVLTTYWDRILIRHPDGRVEVIDDRRWDELRPRPQSDAFLPRRRHRREGGLRERGPQGLRRCTEPAAPPAGHPPTRDTAGARRPPL